MVIIYILNELRGERSLESFLSLAVYCTNYVGKKPGLRFFRFLLLDRERNAKWTAAVNC